MTPTELKKYLHRIVTHNIQLSTMIWGPPGIGKSSIVAQIARRHKMEFIDLRLSQLAPTDLRGLPVAENGKSKWYPPEFLPSEGKGILFLDEINMAPPTMQGVAQQLILDRQVGSYQVPPKWLVWAAGNRKEDRASVFDMPAPLANRFLHLQVEPDFDSFKSYAIANKVDEQIIAFLSFRPTLLHKIDPQKPTWPSPRSWVMANQLLKAKLDITPAVGEATQTEFKAFIDVYRNLPDIGQIFQGNGHLISFPKEPSVRYATTIALAFRAKDQNDAYNAFVWLNNVTTSEWVRLFALDLLNQLRAKDKIGIFATLVQKDQRLQDYLKEFRQLMES